MPIYTYGCDHCESEVEQFNTYDNYKSGAPECCGSQTHIRITPPLVVAVDNMPSYRCPVTNQEVVSRKQRNEIFAKHDLVDGNDIGPPTPPKPPPKQEVDIPPDFWETATPAVQF